MNESLDCMILDCIPSYCSQIVRLCAEEKGLKWSRYDVDIFKFINLEPWYVNLNPGAYVPTILVNPNNTPVCESASICKYLDTNFEGITSLLNPSTVDE